MAHAVTGLLGVDLDDSPTTSAGFALGTTIYTNDGGSYQYVQCATAVTQYHVVGIDEDYKISPLTKTIADDGWRIGVASQSGFAADDFGWVQLTGTTTLKVLGSCAADVTLYTTATAGALDDTSASQTNIDGIVITTTNSTTAAANVEAILSWPRSTTF